MHEEPSIAQLHQSLPKPPAVNNNNPVNNGNNINNNNIHTKLKTDRMFSLCIKRSIINEAIMFIIDTINIIAFFCLMIIFYTPEKMDNYDEAIQKQLIGMSLIILFTLICSMMFFFRVIKYDKVTVREVCYRLGHCTNEVVGDSGVGGVGVDEVDVYVSEVYYCYKKGYVVRCQEHPDTCICSYKLHWLSSLISNELSFLTPSLYLIQLISNLSILAFATYLIYLLFNNYFTNLILLIDVLVLAIIVWIGHGMFLLFLVWNMMRMVYGLVKVICPCFFTQKPPQINNHKSATIESKKPSTTQRKSLPPPLPPIINRNTVRQQQQTANCSICLDPLRNGTDVAILQCSDKHRFHNRCIESWRNVKSTCPACRSNIVIRRVAIL